MACWHRTRSCAVKSFPLRQSLPPDLKRGRSRSGGAGTNELGQAAKTSLRYRHRTQYPTDDPQKAGIHESNIRTTRGFVILVARLITRKHKRIFRLCHYFAIAKLTLKHKFATG